MECSSKEENGSRNARLQKRQRTEDDNIRSAMVDFDVLDCPICFEKLSKPIFQCDNGHLSCSSCFSKLRNRCPSCASPIGQNRCRAMETVLESVFVPCPNTKYGCTEIFSFGKESTHHKECNFYPCSCPAQDCNFTGSYKNLYDHCNYFRKRKDSYKLLLSGGVSSFNMNIGDKISIQKEREPRFSTKKKERRDYCFQCSVSASRTGVYVTVYCIAPSTPEVGMLSYRLSYTTVDGHTITYESPEVKMIQEVSFQTPQDNFMLIPRSLLRGESLRMKLCIKMLNKEKKRC